MSKKIPLVALLTDFGLHDQYVAVMKGVMLSICPAIRFIDISHDVQPQHIEQGAYLLWASHRFLPSGAIIGSVVDPGVGTPRTIVLAKGKRHTYVGPDNGIFDLVFWEEGVREVVVLDVSKALRKRLVSEDISSTFHGRDIVAPVCAHIALGQRLSTFGQRKKIHPIHAPFVSASNPGVPPRIMNVDRFGNIITNILVRGQEDRSLLKGIEIGGITISRWAASFAEAPPDVPCLIIGSSGLVEIFIRNGNAASSLLSGASTSLKLAQ
jgi:S-adenosylmethionine hydrolase